MNTGCIDVAKCALKLVDGNIAANDGDEIITYEQWQCECGTNMLYDCRHMYENERYEWVCPDCGAVYVFDATIDGVSVYPVRRVADEKSYQSQSFK